MLGAKIADAAAAKQSSAEQRSGGGLLLLQLRAGCVHCQLRLQIHGKGVSLKELGREET